MSELEGKVCLVTGGAGHIGRAICEALLSQGAEVIAVGRREPATPVAHGGRAAAFISADVRDAAASSHRRHRHGRGRGSLGARRPSARWRRCAASWEPCTCWPTAGVRMAVLAQRPAA